MAGFDLKEASYIRKELTEDELWSIFAGMFSNKAYHDTTYKFGFFKSILDSLYNANEELVLTFDQLFYKFTEIYWNLVLKGAYLLLLWERIKEWGYSCGSFYSMVIY